MNEQMLTDFLASNVLKHEEKTILKLRYVQKKTLFEISKIIGRPIEKVEKIEKKVLRQLMASSRIGH